MDAMNSAPVTRGTSSGASSLVPAGLLLTASAYSHSGTTTSYAVEFQYVVDGRTYRSDLGTPDGKVPLNPLGRAYYKPGSPEIAVLDPAPFQGTAYLMTFLVSGVIVGTHLYFTLAGRIGLFRLGRRNAKRAEIGS
jgi:hypothetical protein